MKILVTRRLFPETIERLRGLAEVDYRDLDENLPAAELAQRVVGCAGLMAGLTDRIDAALLAGADGLKVVSNVAVGYNNIDVAACTAAGVMVTNTPGVLNETTADMAWTLLMASARRVVAADAWTRAGNWQGWKFQDPWMGQDVHGATLGILGMGRIGQAVARRAQGFDMRVIYHSRTRPDATSHIPGRAQWVAKERLFSEADFIVLLVPYTPQTHHAVAAPESALMKPTAHLINIARGGVVDDVALIEALRERRIAGAGMDVFEGEPALNPGFRTLDNVTLTPHIGSSTRATRLAMANCAADNLCVALTGQAPPNLINPDVILERVS